MNRGGFQSPLHESHMDFWRLLQGCNGFTGSFQGDEASKGRQGVPSPCFLRGVRYTLQNAEEGIVRRTHGVAQSGWHPGGPITAACYLRQAKAKILLLFLLLPLGLPLLPRHPHRPLGAHHTNLLCRVPTEASES